jgi:D-proline reductase (dithiol) PrdB
MIRRREMSVNPCKDTMFEKLFTRFPGLVERWAKSHDFVINVHVPWAPLRKDLKDSRVALLTTAGVHLRSQPAYDMEDREGDPTFREIPADQDINVVFPIERPMELEAERVIGPVAPRHFSSMGPYPRLPYRDARKPDRAGGGEDVEGRWC